MRSTRRTVSIGSISNEHDALISSDDHSTTHTRSISRGGVACPFPWKLHDMLVHVSENDMEHIVSWDADGQSFCVHDSRAFVQQILPKFFSQTKYASFQRQLNLYGFSRDRRPGYHGTAANSSSSSWYRHEKFLRGQQELVSTMMRCKIKGTGKKRTFKSDAADGGDGSSSSAAHYFDSDGTRTTTGMSAPKSPKSSTATLVMEDFFDDFDDEDDMSVPENQVMKDGDLLFFEGSPFHFLEPKTFMLTKSKATCNSLPSPPAFPVLALSNNRTISSTHLVPRANQFVTTDNMNYDEQQQLHRVSASSSGEGGYFSHNGHHAVAI